MTAPLLLALPPVDWHKLFVPSVSPLELVLRGSIMYLAIPASGSLVLGLLIGAGARRAKVSPVAGLPPSATSSASPDPDLLLACLPTRLHPAGS